MRGFSDTLVEHREISRALTQQSATNHEDMGRLVAQTRKLISESYDLLAKANILLATDTWRDRSE